MDLVSVLRAAGTDKIPSDIATPVRNHGAPLQGWSPRMQLAPAGHVMQSLNLFSVLALYMRILTCARDACHRRACL